MSGSGRPTSPARLVVAVVVPLLVGVALSVWFVDDEQSRARLSADASVRATVAGVVGEVRTAIRDQVDAAATPQPGDTVVPARAVSSRVSPTAAALARDGGAAVLDDTVAPASIVVPVFKAGTSPLTTAERRADITGYRVVPLRLGPVVSPLAPAEGGLIVRGPTRRIVELNGHPPRSARQFSVDLRISGAPGWVVGAWLPDPGIAGTTWLSVLGLLALFIAIAVVLVFVLRRADAAVQRRTQLERDRRLITSIAPVLQASLDMGEVLPAVSAELSAELKLAGLDLSVPTAAGERKLFAWGVPPDSALRPAVGPPAQLEAGQTFALALTRGGRALGVLRVVAGEPLSHDDLIALSTASELLGSTLANAETYTQQQELLARMRSVDELKTVFLATASHELRTPVTAIVGFSTLLLGQWDTGKTGEGRQLLERVVSNGRRLEALIEQLLDFSRLERGLPSSGDELLDLGRTVRRVLADQPELTADHVLREQVAEGCTVRGASSAIERIVTNLVGNAAKYSPSGTTITVTVRGQDGESGRVQLLVDDEGPGVAEEDRGRVFSRFYRGRGDSVSRTKGAGIGLAIVAEFVAAMGGTVAVSRAPGGGARFAVSLPALRIGESVPSGEGNSDVALA